MDRDLDSIRFVTRQLKDLQGLRSMVPLGLLQLAPGIIAGFGGVPRLLPWIIGFQVVASVAAFFLMFSSRSYYRSYGHVGAEAGGFREGSCALDLQPGGPGAAARGRSAAIPSPPAVLSAGGSGDSSCLRACMRSAPASSCIPMAGRSTRGCSSTLRSWRRWTPAWSRR